MPENSVGMRNCRNLRRTGRMAMMCFLAIIFVLFPPPVSAAVTVIGNQSLGAAGEIDKNILARIYTGRAVQISGISVKPVNMNAGDLARSDFIRDILQQSDDDYISYWIVRRAIGKGTPPVELNTVREMVDYVRSTPGAVGYIDTSQTVSGVKILLSLP